MPRRLLAPFAGVGLLAAAFLFASQADSEAPPMAPVVKKVRVAEASNVRDVRELRLRGVTRAARRARLSFLVSGRVQERPVDVGDRVAAGQPLARLDDREVRNAVASAEARLAEAEARRSQAERDHRRVEELVESRAATPEELEATGAALETARAAEKAAAAARSEARRLLREVRLNAPFDGTVTAVGVEPGEWIAPGAAVVTLSGAGEVEVEVEAPANLALHLVEGGPARVELPDSPVGERPGVIRSVSRAASGPGSLFPILVTLEPDPAIVAGLAAEVVLELDRGETVAVPVEAVVDPGGRRPAVFRVRDGRAERIEVRVDALRGERVAVRGGLEAGDRVVVGGQRGLLDGEAVEVVP